MHILHGCVVAMLVLASGCATMNPYVQHSRNVSKANIEACRAMAGPDEALDYACGMAIRMEKARAEIVTTRSGLTATIFPLVGLIGYNSARGINAPTNAALAAGGFASYSAVTTLAQPDRIRAYDSGLRSTYCAIGVYQIGVAGEAPESAGRRTLRLEAARVRELVEDYRREVNADAVALNELARVISTVAGIEQWLAASDPNRTVQSQLLAFVRSTLAKVNSQLTLTVPDNKQFIGDALATIQSTPMAKSGRSVTQPLLGDKSAIAAIASDAKSRQKANALNDAVKELVRLQQALIQEAAAMNSTQLNFADCAYVDVADVGIKDGIGRFMLGPGDAYSGATVDVARGTNFTAAVSGGVPPYTATVVQAVGPDAIAASMSGDRGQGLLTVTVPKKSGAVAAGTYRVVVSDATSRYAKWLQINVAANP